MHFRQFSGAVEYSPDMSAGQGRMRTIAGHRGMALLVMFAGVSACEGEHRSYSLSALEGRDAAASPAPTAAESPITPAPGASSPQLPGDGVHHQQPSGVGP